MTGLNGVSCRLPPIGNAFATLEKGDSMHVRKGATTLRSAVMVLIGLLVAPSIIVSCKGGPGIQGEDASIKGLQEGQKQILERLKKIEDTLTAMSKPRRPPIDYNKIYDIPIGDSAWRGAKDAEVTLVEFSDFQCPFSKGVQPLIQQLLDAFPKDLRHVYKNYPLPFHQRALPAAKACLATGEQGKYWEMSALIFGDQKKLEDADLLEYAKKLGLDLKRFEEDTKAEKVQKQIEADLKDVGTAEVTGTPTLFINGKRVQDRTFDAMKQTIEKILKGEEAKPAS